MAVEMLTGQTRRFGRRLSIALLALAAVSLGEETKGNRLKYVVADGWHPWYEIKADPEDARNLVICGTRWDSQRNAPLGFVYVSADGGASWKAVVTDEATAWVSEQSCAFGANHKIYFVSSASKIVDGTPHHELGRTRLFLSNDAGDSWRETVSTGWVDYSTSAVSSANGRLYTFFNLWSTADAGRGRGSSVGLLVFSPSGRSVSGPFIDSKMRGLEYRGVFPSQAIALKDGAVVASYFAIARSSKGSTTYIGIVHANSSAMPSIRTSIISRLSKSGQNCSNPRDSSLAYDRRHGRLFLLYLDRCDPKNEFMLTESADEGRTWSMTLPLSLPANLHGYPSAPSLIVCPDGVLGLLWMEEGTVSSVRWLFSYIRNHQLGSPLELGQDSAADEVSNDSLWSSLTRGGQITARGVKQRRSSSFVLKLSSQPSSVWRVGGLVQVGSHVFALWPEVGTDGAHLYLEDLQSSENGYEEQTPVTASMTNKVDVTRQTQILYGGKQEFEKHSGTLQTCLSLKNRGSDDLRTPIELRAEALSSGVGSVSVANATNDLTGIGAVWDVSGSVTGDRIPAGASSNPFCLCFHLNLNTLSNEMRPEMKSDLLTLRFTVTARPDVAKQAHRR